MKKNLYIFSDSVIQRKDNTLLCSRTAKEDEIEEEVLREREENFFGEDIIIPTGDKKFIPVETIESIIAFGSLRFNSGFIDFLSRNSIPMHFFGYYGNYAGSYFPPYDT